MGRRGGIKWRRWREGKKIEIFHENVNPEKTMFSFLIFGNLNNSNLGDEIICKKICRYIFI
jgi:hypothetical protein